MIQTPFDLVTQQLRSVLEPGTLPPPLQRSGEKMLAHLQKPTVIAAIGLQGCGKSSLLNMILGTETFPKIEKIAIIELVYGKSNRVICETSDGQTLVCDGTAQQVQIPANTMRLRQEMPHPDLKNQSFVKVTLPGITAQGHDILTWLTQRADIAIWCSSTFDQGEKDMWSQVPETLKDHSFLALTMADKAQARGELSGRIADLERGVAEEFLGIFPIATHKALAARRAQPAPDDGAWKSSGGLALNHEIQRQITSGRTADLDHAQAILERASQMAPPPQPKNAARPDQRTDLNETPQPAPRSAQARTTPPAQNPSRRNGPADKDPVLRQALKLLQGSANRLVKTAASATAEDRDTILDLCAKTAEDLAELLAKVPSENKVLDTLRDEAFEAEQMVMELQQQGGESAAKNAMAVLLQLKKEIAQKVYA